MVLKHSLLSGSILSGVMLIGSMIGCSGRPSLLPNSDPALRKTSAELAADAAKRHPFKANLPRGGDALGRASVDYTFKKIELLNYSDEDWNNAELWINEKFVLFVPKIAQGKEGAKVLYFQMFFDDTGNYFWTQNGKIRVDKLDVVRDGKLYSIKLALAD